MEYIVTLSYDTSVGEIIRVQAPTPKKACEAAVRYGDGKGGSTPSELLIWRPSVEALQDDDYQALDVPTKYASARARIEALEGVLRQLVAIGAEYPLLSPLIQRARELVDNGTTTEGNEDT